jgi:hypothetical protein
MATETQVELEPVKASPPKPRLSSSAGKRISKSARRSKLRVIGAAALVFGVIIGLVFFAHYQSHESTDDAFIDVDSVKSPGHHGKIERAATHFQPVIIWRWLVGSKPSTSCTSYFVRQCSLSASLVEPLLSSTARIFAAPW